MVIKEYHVRAPNGRKNLNVLYKCDFCGDECHTGKYNLDLEVKHRCKRCANRATGKLKRGKPSKKKGRTFINLQRENSINWKGGRYINKAGYVMILIKSGSTDRKSGWENYRPEHIILSEAILGRRLKKTECVHHIDGNRQNNNPENLIVIKSHKHHRNAHMSLQRIGYMLYKMGKITFNRKTGNYELLERGGQ